MSGTRPYIVICCVFTLSKNVSNNVHTELSVIFLQVLVCLILSRSGRESQSENGTELYSAGAAAR